MDLTVAILDATGTTVSNNTALDGESLRPALNQSAPLKRKALYFHYPHYAFHGLNQLGSAIRKGNYNSSKTSHQSLELYDLHDDIGESRNLADDQPQIADDLRKNLNIWLASVGAKQPTHIQQND